MDGAGSRHLSLKSNLLLRKGSKMLALGRRSATTAVLCLGLSAAVTAPAGAAPARTWTDVQHNVTLATEFFPDDICGERPSYETWTNKVQVNHLTERPDGSFTFVDFETSLIAVDYVDPNIRDTTFRWTETFTINLTRGGTYINTTTFRQSDGTLTLRARYHLTVVNGVPKIEREASFVDGCP
jgi:hypothetical protein